MTLPPQIENAKEINKAESEILLAEATCRICIMRVYRADERKWVDLPRGLGSIIVPGELCENRPGVGFPAWECFPQGEARIKKLSGDRRRKDA